MSTPSPSFFRCARGLAPPTGPEGRRDTGCAEAGPREAPTTSAAPGARSRPSAPPPPLGPRRASLRAGAPRLCYAAAALAPGARGGVVETRRSGRRRPGAGEPNQGRQRQRRRAVVGERRGRGAPAGSGNVLTSSLLHSMSDDIDLFGRRYDSGGPARARGRAGAAAASGV